MYSVTVYQYGVIFSCNFKQHLKWNCRWCKAWNIANKTPQPCLHSWSGWRDASMLNLTTHRCQGFWGSLTSPPLASAQPLELESMCWQGRWHSTQLDLPSPFVSSLQPSHPCLLVCFAFFINSIISFLWRLSKRKKIISIQSLSKAFFISFFTALLTHIPIIPCYQEYLHTRHSPPPPIAV